MNRIIISLLALMLAVGCSNHDMLDNQTPNEDNSGKVNIRLSIPDIQVVQGRSVDENTVGDVHFFMFGPMKAYRLVPARQTTLEVNGILPGSYTLYAFTNCDGIHSALSAQQLDSFVFSDLGTANGNTLAMSCRTTFTTDSSGMYGIVMQLKRAVAKVSFSICVAEGVEVDIMAVGLCNVPDKGNAFSKEPDGNALEIPDAEYGTVHWLSETDSKTIEYGPYYLPENLRGMNTGITEPGRRGRSRAPENSTHLLIRGKTADGVVDYYVYMGNNDTDDFNLVRNRHYVYNVDIVGTSSNDSRVRYYRMLFDTQYSRPYYNMSVEPFSHRLVLVSSLRTYRFNLHVECLEGDLRYLTADGEPFVDGMFDFGDVSWGGISNNRRLDLNLYYSPPIFTEENNIVKIRYVLTDNYGHKTYIEQEYFFTNVCRLYTRWDGMSTNTVSSIEGGNILSGYLVPGADVGYWHTRLAEDGWVRYQALAQAPYKFKGWYSDPELTEFFSYDMPVTYKVDRAYMALYPKVE